MAPRTRTIPKGSSTAVCEHCRKKFVSEDIQLVQRIDRANFGATMHLCGSCKNILRSVVTSFEPVVGEGESYGY